MEDADESSFGEEECVGGCRWFRNVADWQFQLETHSCFSKEAREALAEITLHVRLPQLSFIQDDDPAIVWNALATVHQARGMATRLALHRTFLHLQKTDGPMQNFISEARRIAFQLTEIGIAVDDEDIILVLTRGLPSTYKNFIIILDSTPTSQLTLDYVISHLLNEEA